VAVTDRLLSVCMQYPWPGNLRELESFVKRFLVLGNEQEMIAELSSGTMLPAPSTAGAGALSTPAGGLKKMMSGVKGEAEAKVISYALQEHQWKRKKTAAELKISYKALLYKIRQYGIVAPPSEPMC
jgi:two-component system response regulator AtoC